MIYPTAGGCTLSLDLSLWRDETEMCVFGHLPLGRCDMTKHPQVVSVLSLVVIV